MRTRSSQRCLAQPEEMRGKRVDDGREHLRPVLNAFSENTNVPFSSNSSNSRCW